MEVSDGGLMTHFARDFSIEFIVGEMYFYSPPQFDDLIATMHSRYFTAIVIQITLERHSIARP